jgi:hypothetical protein
VKRNSSSSGAAGRNATFTGLSILPTMALTLREITVDFFRNTEGRNYRFEQPAEGGYVDLELLEVGERRASAWPGGREIPFALLFRAVDNAVLRPGLPRLVHPDVGNCEMSLQRIMPPPGYSANAVYYEAVFN